MVWSKTPPCKEGPESLRGIEPLCERSAGRGAENETKERALHSHRWKQGGLVMWTLRCASCSTRLQGLCPCSRGCPSSSSGA